MPLTQLLAVLGISFELVMGMPTTTPPVYKSCGSPNVTGMQCVPYERCNEGLMVDGHFYPERSRTLLDERSCHYMEKCCKIENTLPRGTPAPHNATTDYLQCGWRLDSWYYLRPLGYKQQEAKFGEFPWLVAVYNVNGSYLCSGALITPFVVLTAAHCVQREALESLQLVAGEWDAAVQLEPLPHQTQPVAEVLVHPNYTQAPAAHNVALLFAGAGGFQLAPHVQTICLPPLHTVYNYTQCYVAGWRRSHFGANETLPKRWPLYALPRDQCASKLRLAILGRRYALNDTLICTGGDKGEFVCKDMGGVPLMCLLPGCDDRFVLAGLLARAARCDGPQLLGIYTNMMFYRRWIDQKLRERDLDIRQYMV
ncbi:phenoloxidase-activating factor 2 [Scaptodrosophila lebanonensis]|uniref:Phenoloxidase-activating factor 2 n=1 Tax=Drosophila lebanonensis TaxID=7225 RepID=A0A6J2TQH2_DROLE|nr:phenoloxidase-activating factor 2 [Scaptodrosophila lebanonensis]